MKVLVIGYGNSGRRDDGLGPRVAEAVATWRLPGAAALVDWQLNIEHAVDLAAADTVVFADASVSGAEPYEFRELEESPGIAFTTHSFDPASALALCRDLYRRAPRAYLLAVRGYDFEFGDDLSPRASRNMRAALAFLRPLMRAEGSADRAGGFPV